MEQTPCWIPSRFSAFVINCNQSRIWAADLPPARQGPDTATCSTQLGHHFPPFAATQFWQQFTNTIYTQEVAWSCMNQLNYSAPVGVCLLPASSLDYNCSSINLRCIKLSSASLWEGTMRTLQEHCTAHAGTSPRPSATSHSCVPHWLLLKEGLQNTSFY